MADDKTIGGRRRNKNNNDDVHATGRATRNGKSGGDDVHATGRAVRDGNNGATDVHATGKADGRGADRARPFEQKGDATLRNRVTSHTGNVEKKGWPDTFVLDGLKYKNDGILSDSSGEAVVFTVSRGGKKFALKIYYYDPDHRPNHKVLEKIKQLGGSGLLVNIISHGEWENPDIPGEKNDYELMDFCEGGSLDGVILDGDEKALTEVAVRMASAIDFLAKHGIIHRDIKPGNFFYADKAKTQIVLADFGISMECPPGGFVKIDEMRSPVYAAPEFYTNVPGEPAEAGVESDYFSLGVSLLCLWMGKDKLTANESQLLRSKLNETLPMPADMSAHMASLIKALTRLKMSDRATFDDIRRWVSGESLDPGENAESVNSDFRVVFNSAKNLVAHSPAELARLLVDDPELGKKYLYSARVTGWLEDTGRNEIAVNVEEIVEKIYPDNQNSGLMAVAYLLDPSMDYVAPDGERFDNPADIATHIFLNHSELGDEVLDEDSTLMVYLRAQKLDKTLAALREYIDSDEFQNEEDQLKSYMATYYLAILLNDDLTFPVSVGDDWEYANDIDQLLSYLHQEGDLDLINRSMLESQSFIVWLSYRRPDLAGKVRMLHDNSNDDIDSPYYMSDSAYRIIYELDPQVDYDFGTDPDDPDRVYDIRQIGRYLNDRLNNMCQGKEDQEAFDDLFVEMDSHPLGQYLRARGEHFMTFLSWNRYCMDVDSEENSSKAGPYDQVIGAYKSVAGFLGDEPVYVLDGKEISSPAQLKDFSSGTVARAIGGPDRVMPEDDEKPVPWLDAWLTVFFQENPKLDLSKQFTYERETAEYTEFIAHYAPDNYYAERYMAAIDDIDQSAGQVKKTGKSVKTRRNIFLIAGGLPTLIMIFGTLIFGLPESNPIQRHILETFIICVVGVFIYRTILWGFIDTLFSIWTYVIGLVIAGAIFGCFAVSSETAGWVGLGALVLYMAYYAWNLFKRDKVNTNGVEIRGDEFEYRQLDALYFAYRETGSSLDNVITQYSESQQKLDKRSLDNVTYVGCRWVSIVWTLAVIWFFITPQLSGDKSWVVENAVMEAKAGTWVLGKWDARYTSGSTRIVCNIDSVEDGSKLYGTMIIAGQAPVRARGTVKSDNDTIPRSFAFWVAEGNDSKQKITGKYDEKTKSMTGYYLDRKGRRQEITFVSDPVSGEKAPEPSKPAAQKSTKKSQTKTETTVQEPAPEPTSEQSSEPVEAETTHESVLCEDTM